jgi:uncharacterized cupredoxin-like copper-binding protein
MNHHYSLGLVAALAMLTSPVSFAHGDATHAPKAHAYNRSQVVDTAFGRQGDPRKVTRTVTVDMTDNMRFTPDVLKVQRGETVRLNVMNKGRVLHELVLGTPSDIQEHWQAMKQHPGMAHEQPQSAHVAAGSRGEVVWQFTQPGEFQFACLLPGHFEAGMAGKVVVE